MFPGRTTSRFQREGPEVNPGRTKGAFHLSRIKAIQQSLAFSHRYYSTTVSFVSLFENY